MGKFRDRLDFFADDVSYFITSMGSRKEKFIDDITAGGPSRVKHLLKLYFYSEAGYKQGTWKKSVWSATFEVRAYKKLPPFKFVFDEIWGKPYSTTIQKKLPGLVRNISDDISEYRPPRFPLSVEIINNCVFFLERYHAWLSKEFSEAGVVTRYQVSEEIDRLLQEPTYLSLVSILK